MMQLKPFTAEQLGYRLCYVSGEGPFLLWFTSLLDKQTGDDWNDSPWWCNAGEPYDHVDIQLATVCLDGSYRPNDERVSVDAINKKRLSWLVSYGPHPAIQAGITLGEFLGTATKYRLKVYLEADLLS